MNKNCKVFLACLATLLLLASCGSKIKIEDRALRDGWMIASSKEVSGDAKALSEKINASEKWYKATLPTTVLGALVDAGEYKDVFVGKNLEKVPRARFENNWWFRNTFTVEDFDAQKEQLRLLVEGINYRANFWVNGKQIAKQDTLFGAFRQFDLDITQAAQKGENTLLVEIFPPKVRDFYMGYVDWAPTPPDHFMGIYRDIRLKRSGKVSLNSPFVAPDVDTKDLTKASVTVSTEVQNHGNEAKKVEISGRIEDITFKKTVQLAPNERQEVKFTPQEFAQLNLKNPRLWWPNGLGEPAMYKLELEVNEQGLVQDAQSTKFGVRKIETALNDKGVRGYKVNGATFSSKAAVG